MSRKAGIILSTIIGIIVGLWLWSGIIPKTALSIGGSTSVDPVMQRLTNTYKKDNGSSFVYSSSGSAGGVSNVKSGTYKMGFISKLIPTDGSVPLVSNELKDQFKWTTNTQTNSDFFYNYFTSDSFTYNSDSMHSIRIGEDAIILTYQAPETFEKYVSPEFDMEVNNGKVDSKSQKIIQSIYGGDATWNTIGDEINSIKPIDNYSSIDKTGWDATIIPFARETGSGTRNTFDSMFGLGSYATDTDGKTKPSKATEFNSNGMMFNNFKVNTFGYVSMNYMDAIVANKNLKTVLVNKKDPRGDNGQKPMTIDDIKEYGLKRPFIGLIEADLDHSDLRKISDFLGWISVAQFDHSSSAYQQFKTSGLEPSISLDSSIDVADNTWPTTKVKTTNINKTLSSLRMVMKTNYIEPNKD